MKTREERDEVVAMAENSVLICKINHVVSSKIRYLFGNRFVFDKRPKPELKYWVENGRMNIQFVEGYRQCFPPYFVFSAEWLKEVGEIFFNCLHEEVDSGEQDEEWLLYATFVVKLILLAIDEVINE